jgi:hypothetical protein
MAKIKIEDFDQKTHPNYMWHIDNEQFNRYQHAGGHTPYTVCVVEVCGFQFIFHSTMQIELCLDYYSRQTRPSSRLPVYREHLGGDHGETQRWFERLPLYLLENAKRPKVVAALERALLEYRRQPGALTSTPKPKLWP